MEQIRIVNEVLHDMKHSENIKNIIKGFMIESYIEDDPCLGFEKTKKLIYQIFNQL